MRSFDTISQQNQEFISSQRVFFVGSAPLSEDGHVNVSPKGLDTFAILGEDRVAYLDLGGSGIETHAHLRENGRLCVMFCAFDGDPKILRLYGSGRAHGYATEGFDELRSFFGAMTVPVRGIMELEISRVQESCGWGVPLFDFKGNRDRLLIHNAKRSQEEYIERRYQGNRMSIDGLPGLDRP